MNQISAFYRSSVTRVLSFSIVFIGLVLSCSSCANDSSAKVRVLNFSPDTESIDVFDNDGTLFNAISYSEASDYNSISTETSKNHEITISPTNSFSILSSSSKSFTSKKTYSIFLFDFGLKASAIFELDDNSNPSSGRAKLRFVHASPSNKNIDLYITSPNARLENTLPAVESINFKRISDYLENKEGDYQIRVTLKGDKNVIADSGLISFAAGKIYTVALIEAPRGGAPYDIAIYLDK